MFYWKNGNRLETDFLIRTATKVSTAIQVAARLNTPKTQKREIAGLLAAVNHFDLKEGSILTGDESGSEMIEGKTIRYQPIWQWLLEGASN